MDTSYAMAKFGLESKDTFKSKQKGCWHYMKYVFIFSSIIQFLIILGLVLFMLYGNAHGGTELRLKSVEYRYKNLTVDYAYLKGNFSLLKDKLASTEKDVKNCSDIVVKMSSTIARMNVTIPPQRPLPIPGCSSLQAVLNNLNMTCYTERLKAQNYKMLLELQFSQYKNNCTKAMAECVNKEHLASSENVQLKRDNKDLGTQIKLIKDSCTSIDERFRVELQNFKNVIEASLKTGDTHDLQLGGRCKLLSDTVSTRIDFTLGRLRQDVNNFVYENTQIRANNQRITEDLEKCNQDKNIVTGERNNIAADKTSLEKQLGIKKDELNKCYSILIKKQEDLDNCLKPPMRPPVFPLPGRT